MKIFLDTSVLVAATLEDHPDHDRALAAVERIQNGLDDGVISAHSIAEVYATLTSIPAPHRHTPEQALLSIEENFLKYVKTSSLNGADYAAVIREGAGAGIQGGTIYDALLMKSAGKEKVDRILTLNLRHFRLVASPGLAKILTSP